MLFRSRFGFWLLAFMAIPLQLLMAWVNQTPVGSVVPSRFVMRSLWFVVAFAITELLVDALRRGALELGTESDRAGRQEKRAVKMRELHDGVLQVLLGIEDRCSRPSADSGGVLHQMGAESKDWSLRIRALLATDGGEWGTFGEAMRALVVDARQAGPLLVELVPRGPEPELDGRAGRALVGAAGEAIRNARRHADATVVRVMVDGDEVRVRVIVADNGKGFCEADTGHGSGGYGIENSIRAALRDVGGRADLVSEIGGGTSWELTVPTQRRPATRLLVDRTVVDLAIVTIWYRLLGLSISAAGLVSSRSFGPIDLAPILGMMAVVAVSQVVLIRALRRDGSKPTGWWFVAVDLIVTATLSLFAAAAVPARTVLLDYRDPFALYAQGTLALWGAVRSRLASVVLLVVMAGPLQIAMAQMNGIPIASIDWAKLGSRALWLVPALLLGRVVMSVAREGAHLLAEENHAAGRADERADHLREVHLSALVGLDAITERSGSGADPSVLLSDVRSLAHREVVAIRAALDRTDPSPHGHWRTLEAVIADIEEGGKACVALVCRGSEPTAAFAPVQSLFTAVGRLLDSAAATTPCRATVFAEASADGVRLVLRHDGRPSSPPLEPMLLDDRVSVSASTTPDGQERIELFVARTGAAGQAREGGITPSPDGASS